MIRHTEAVRTHHTSERSFASISTERATEIQGALIKQGYMTGEPTGSWDSASVAAMQKLQEDNGWQTKLVPDSRALIKLGLGPDSNPAASAPSASAAPASEAIASAALPASH